MPGKVFHAELWGTRAKKYAELLDNDLGTTEWTELKPQSPFCLFTPQDTERLNEYEQGWKVTDVFSVNSVGLVTARDGLTIRWSEQDVWDVVRDFVKLPPEEAREKYNLGRDVRDWKVKLAQKDIKTSGPKRNYVAAVLYRPFDIRFTYYTGKTRGFICMPRPEIMRHMLAGENLGLVTTRLTKEQWDVLVTNNICGHKSCAAYDINSVFPLYLYPDPKKEGDLFANGASRHANLNPEFIREMEERLGLSFVQDEGGPQAGVGAGEDAGVTAGEDAGATNAGATNAGAAEDAGLSSAAVSAAVSGASRPRYGGVRIRDRGHLPHWEMEGGVYFVTFRLFDSLPRSVLEQIKAERERLMAADRDRKTAGTAALGGKAAETAALRRNREEQKRIAKLFSERIEAYLDAGTGACYLSDARVAELTATALRHFDGKRYRLFAWCIMPNHVHVVFRPLPGHELARVLHSWKSFTAKKANAILGRKGPFWQREYYDHLIRDEEEFNRTLRYVLENPDRAGLTDWAWVDVCGQDARATAGEDAGAENTVGVRGQDARTTAGEDAGATNAGVTNTFGPEDVFHYIYAVLHSPTYRERYAEFLRIDFPRVPLTSDKGVFRTLCAEGKALVGLHLLESPTVSKFITRYPVPGDDVVQKGHPRYLGPGEPEPGTGQPLETGRVYISKDAPKSKTKGQYFDGVPPEVWAFHVGGYQVCEKWLKDRRGRKLSYDDLEHYQKIVVALHETIRLMDQIDEVIPGWPLE